MYIKKCGEHLQTESFVVNSYLALGRFGGLAMRRQVKLGGFGGDGGMPCSTISLIPSIIFEKLSYGCCVSSGYSGDDVVE